MCCSTPRGLRSGETVARSRHLGGAVAPAASKRPQLGPEVNMEVTIAMTPATQQPERTVEPAEGALEPGVGDES